MAEILLFTATPLSPWIDGYKDPESEDPYAQGWISTYGGLTWPRSTEELPLTFADQYNNDEIIVGNHAVPLTNRDWTEGVDPNRRSTICLEFEGYNVSRDNQYVLYFELRGVFGSPSAQFFVGTDWVATKELGQEIHGHGILLPCRDSGDPVSVIVRLASEYWNAAMGFRSVECKLLL